MFAKFIFSLQSSKLFTHTITKRLFSTANTRNNLHSNLHSSTHNGINSGINNSFHSGIYDSELPLRLKTGKITYYDVLQVPANASQSDIKKAFTRLAKEYHPDMNKNKDTRAIFLCIKESHDTLTNHNKRILYNQSLK
eukprot:XP_765837.1 hypothetical protein [Theileria parva strain Muguga]